MEREILVSFLDGSHAHMTLDEAVAKFPLDKMNTLFPNGTYSAWHLLEHIRRVQADILEFITNPTYKDKTWPDDYWPKKGEKATKKEWDQTISLFHKDLKKLKAIALDENIDLNEKIAWGDGQTILREILLVIDHTAYHLGEFAIMRQTMGTWGKS